MRRNPSDQERLRKAQSDLAAALECLSELREGCCALMRALVATTDPRMGARVDAEMIQAGVRRGFGVRADRLLSAHARAQGQAPLREDGDWRTTRITG